jgi:hypothetical protein
MQPVRKAALNTASNVLDSQGAVKYRAGARINKAGRVPLVLSACRGEEGGVCLR